MTRLLELALGNVAMASVIALIAFAVGRWTRRPALTHGLWLLVFLKLLTPPLFPVPVEIPLGLMAAEGNQPAPKEEPAPAPMAPVVQDDVDAVEGPQAEEGLADEAEEDFRSLGDIGSLAPSTPQANVAMDPLPVTVPAAAPPIPLAEEGPSIPWPWIAGGIWLAGSLFWFGLAAVRLLRFRRLLRLAQLATDSLQNEADDLAGQMNVTSPRVWVLPGRFSPMLWVFGRAARLLLPVDLVQRLDPQQRRALLTHELAHWRRRDHWVRWLELVVLGLYWWCPLAWWARRRLEEAEEECCDAWVVWMMPGAARGYALALVDTIDFLAGAPVALPPVASGIGQVRLLQRRLTMIMRGTTPRALTVGGVLAVLALGALLLPLMPTWAQTRAGQDDEKPRPKKDLPKDFFPPEKREQFEKARKEIQRMHEELEKMRAEIERRAQELRRAMERLHQVEGEKPKERPFRPDAKQPGKEGDIKPRFRPDGKPKEGDYFKPFRIPGVDGQRPDMDRRLSEVERKLDMLLKELHDLRRDMGPGRPGPKGFGPGGNPPPPPPRDGGPGGPRPGAQPPPPPPGGAFDSEDIPPPRPDRKKIPAPQAP